MLVFPKKPDPHKKKVQERCQKSIILSMNNLDFIMLQ